MSIRRRSKVWAYCLSLFVLGAAVWLPMTALAQVVPGTPFGAGGGGGSGPTQLCLLNTAQTPDTNYCSTNSLGNSFIFAEAADSGFDFAHAQATDPLLAVHSHNQSTTQWVGLSHDGTNAVLDTGAGAFRFNTAAVWRAGISSNVLALSAVSSLGFHSATNLTAVSVDTSFTRLAAGVFGTTSWVQNTGGLSSLAADYTNATTTFSNTALSITVISGRKYTFKSVLFVSDSLAADGAKFDFNGGSAAATDFRVHCTLFDTALLLSTQAAALATAFSQATITGSGMFECYGSFEPSGAGTFILRAAQNAHTTGTLTIFRGSNIWVQDMP